MDNQIHLLPFWLGFKRTLAEYKRAFPQIWQIALPVIAVAAIASLLQSFSGPGFSPIALLGGLSRLVLVILTSLVVPGILIASVGSDQPFNLKEAYAKSFKKAPQFFGYSLLVVLVLFPTTLFFFVPGIYFSLVLGFFAYSLFLGTKYHSNPLVDSYLHVRGFFWPILYRLLLTFVLIALIYAVSFVAFLIFFYAAELIFHYTSFLPAAVSTLIGNVIVQTFMILVPTPLYYLYGRTLFRDLENARGYTYTDEEKKRASQVVLWTPIVSLIGAGILIFAMATSISNMMQNAQSNLQKAREQAERERTIPARGLNR